MPPTEEMVTAKLKELLGDDEGQEDTLGTMTEYVMVMVNNDKSAEEIEAELSSIFGPAKEFGAWFAEQVAAENADTETAEAEGEKASTTPTETASEKPKSRKISLKSKASSGTPLEKLEGLGKPKAGSRGGSGAKGGRILLNAVKDSVESTKQAPKGKRGMGRDLSLADMISSNNTKNDQSHNNKGNNQRNKKRPATGNGNNRQDSYQHGSSTSRQHSDKQFHVTLDGHRGNKTQKTNRRQNRGADRDYDEGGSYQDQDSGDWEGGGGGGGKGGKGSGGKGMGSWYGQEAAYGGWDQAMYAAQWMYPGKGGGWGGGYGAYGGYGMPAPWMAFGKGKGGGGSKGKGRGKGKGGGGWKGTADDSGGGGGGKGKGGKGKKAPNWNKFVRKDEDTTEMSESLPKTPPESEAS